MRDLRGPALFVAATLVLTWGTATLIDTRATSLLGATLVYAAVVGWQPLVARLLARWLVDDQRALDAGVRAATTSYSVLSIVAPLVLLALAALAAGVRIPSHVALPANVVEAASTALGMIAVLWLQAIAEEIAWRGYLLPRLMRRLGSWPGLLVHGVLWGVCYAPIVFAGNFVVTCCLLGVLLGWLRLASGSVYASAASNATLTICAGLPLALQGAPAPLGAVFEPIGWLPMLAAIAWICLRSPLRAAIAVPERPVPEHVN